MVELLVAARPATTHDEATVTIGAALVFVIVLVVVAVQCCFVAVGRVAFFVFNQLGAEGRFGEIVESRVGVFGFGSSVGACSAGSTEEASEMTDGIDGLDTDMETAEPKSDVLDTSDGGS